MQPDEFDVQEIPLDFLSNKIQKLKSTKKEAKKKKPVQIATTAIKTAIVERIDKVDDNLAFTGEQIWEVWERKRNGEPIHMIALSMKMSIAGVTRLISECYRNMQEDIKEKAEVVREMDLQTCDELIGKYLKIARVDSAVIESIENGVMVARDDVYAPLMAGKVIVEILKHKAKLLGLDRNFEKNIIKSPAEMFVWLKEKSDSMKQLVDSSPIDVEFRDETIDASSTVE